VRSRGVCEVWEPEVSYVGSVTRGRLTSHDRAFGWCRDMSSHHKAVQDRTDSSARPRKVTVKSTAWTRTNGELSIKGLVCMTISIACPDDRERISGICVSFSLAGARVACDGACAGRMLGRKYTTFAGRVCRGRRDFPVKRAEDSGGDDNPVQGCTKRVTLKAERCRRRHFFHIPDRIRATSCQRSPASDTADATNGPRPRIGRRFADDSTSIPSLRDSHV
jgi:hypothetical protein